LNVTDRGKGIGFRFKPPQLTPMRYCCTVLYSTISGVHLRVDISIIRVPISPFGGFATLILKTLCFSISCRRVSGR
jgi:hypothetical protein